MTLPSNTLSAAKSVAVPFRLSSCVIVPHRPFFRGRPGWVRSKAWIWLFSSTHNTIPFCGGFKYRPTTSVNFSMNWGSRDSLKVRLRCGLRLCNCQSRFTVLLLTPWALAMVRQLQCVIPLGLVSSVARIKASRFSSSYFGLHALSPQRDSVSIDFVVGSDFQIGISFCSGQNQPAAQGHLLRGSLSRFPTNQLRLIFCG